MSQRTSTTASKLRTWERGAGLNARLRHRRLRDARWRRSRPSARNRRCKVDMTGGSADDQLGAGRADPDARRRDARVRRRTRPRGAAMSVETITLGCRLNFAESETIARAAPAGRGLDRRQQLRRDQRGRAPDAPGDPPRAPATARRAKILVTGCAAELDPATFATMPGVAGWSEMRSKLNSLRRANDVMAPAPAVPGPRPRASSRSRPAATIAAPSARSGRRAGRAARCRSS